MTETETQPNYRILAAISALAERPVSQRPEGAWTPNKWNGFDLDRVRLAEDDGTVEMFVFQDERRWVTEYAVRFDNAPATVIAAAVLAALNE